ncbi:8452_t:CDS:2, partial [Racocetra persica]
SREEYNTKEKREKIAELNISNKNLEGELDLREFENLKSEISYNAFLSILRLLEAESSLVKTKEISQLPEAEYNILEDVKEKRATPETQKTDNSSLFDAVKNDDIKTVKDLVIEKKVDVNICDQDGFTPLHIAVAREHIEIIKILLAAQANPNTQSKEGHTPLHFAAEGNNLRILKRLVKNKYGSQKGDINAVNKYEGLNTEVETDGDEDFER